MGAKLLILRAHSIFVKQGWEMLWLNSIKGWQNINCRRTYSAVGKKNTQSMRATSTLHQIRWLAWRFCSMHVGGGHLTMSPPLSEPLQTHTFVACQREVMMLYWKYEFCAHSDRARQTEEETQNSLSHQMYICNKVRNSGKCILYGVMGGGGCCLLVGCFSFICVIKGNSNCFLF